MGVGAFFGKEAYNPAFHRAPFMGHLVDLDDTSTGA
jgi:hypothetical protein